ncbi:DUF4382 domain-containing protein [Shewanella schlegeliana]|uniref:DUF4382 domain-containing protein n=1 Tax=Shewanella schlegeliana TaxID=190308 RepID=A0ABS1SYA7_9GAMM|nr:DUF4382 domain-containing protein [Shewanella schlegeliana]MBL4913508.1 DUF4382 domain-containing protein [Shewanella schlegeliana]MCL1108398.1 DUF4382 domain-containing protein [Shewanella schlegeliana]GIU28853.1 lipoprotein [Shewanella schlegeliana]
MKQLKLTSLTIAIATGLMLSGCGSDSDSNEPEQALFSLGVSDNPADANIVNVAFKQVVLKNSEGAFSFDVSTGDDGLQHVDLLSFQGQAVETLVSGQSVPVGEYQMCIYMENNTISSDESSYVLSGATEDENGEFVGGDIEGLVTNSNGSCGGVGADEENTGRLFFNKSFTIAAGNNSFVAEFNLAKGLQAPHGNKNYWTLKPTSVQLVNASEVGAIKGQISQETMVSCEAEAGGSEFSPAVYLYPSETALDQMADFRTGPNVLTQVAPITSARVNPILDSSENVTGYEYEFGFVVADTYSLGYTCLAQNDDPEESNVREPEDDSAPFFIDSAEQDVIVTLGETTIRNFPESFEPVTP